MNKHNDRMTFTPKGHWLVYNSLYTDANENKWQVQVAGEPEPVQQFVETRPLFLEAEALDQAEAARLVEKTRELSEEKGYSGLPEELRVRQPTLSVRITLIELALSSPYHVKFEVDPQISGDSDSYTFQLKGRDTTANVSYIANNGTVSLTLTGSGDYSDGPASSGQVMASGLTGSSWTVTVYRGAATPYYTLSGDKVVY